MSGAVRGAAAGVRAQVAWQVWSRGAAFVIKATAVRAAGPADFAFTTVRLSLLGNASQPVAFGVRGIAVRSVLGDDAAAVLVSAGIAGTCALAAALGVLFAWMEPEYAGVVGLCVVMIWFQTFMERGRVFAIRRGEFAKLERARALARVVGGLVTALTVWCAPAAAGRYALTVGDTAHGVTLFLGCEYAAGWRRIPVVGLGCAREVLSREDVATAGLAVWKSVLHRLLSHGERFVLDMNVRDPAKGAYELAGNVASMLARFFNEALEDQSFNLFSTCSAGFSMRARGDVAGADAAELPEEEARGLREDCDTFLLMGLKLSVLVSILIAVIGPCFSYAFIHLLYGAGWSQDTPAPRLLSLYFTYLVFMAWNGVTEALVSATGSAAQLKDHSKFSVVLSVVYIVGLVAASSRFSAEGFIFVNCVSMTARTMYSLRYYAHLMRKSAAGLVLGVLPHPGVVLVLAVFRAVCSASEAHFLTPSPPTQSLFLRAVVLHAVSGAASVLAFSVATYYLEGGLVKYISALARGASVRKVPLEKAPAEDATAQEDATDKASAVPNSVAQCSVSDDAKKRS